MRLPVHAHFAARQHPDDAVFHQRLPAAAERMRMRARSFLHGGQNGAGPPQAAQIAIAGKQQRFFAVSLLQRHDSYLPARPLLPARLLLFYNDAPGMSTGPGNVLARILFRWAERAAQTIRPLLCRPIDTHLRNAGTLSGGRRPHFCAGAFSAAFWACRRSNSSRASMGVVEKSGAASGASSVKADTS